MGSYIDKSDLMPTHIVQVYHDKVPATWPINKMTGWLDLKKNIYGSLLKPESTNVSRVIEQ